uniref:Reverse transcriptase domain-containing protein n=1 Tax=Xenopus tropicalis TaxID=8364 RepID=A0A803K3T5_XENTR
MGLTESWRHTHPTALQYSCFSTSHMSLSRIDMAFLSQSVLVGIKECKYLPRGISDHAPLLITWETHGGGQNKRWVLNPVWLDIIDKDEAIATEILEFFQMNQDSASPAIVWDTFKAYLRGTLHREITAVKRGTTQIESELAQKVENCEIEAISNPTPLNFQNLQSAQTNYATHLAQKSKRKLLFTHASYFEQGERAGKLLAYISKTNCSPPVITELIDQQGLSHTHPTEIATLLSSYYASIYSSQTSTTPMEINSFLSALNLPRLTDEQKISLEADLTLTELNEAIDMFPTRKAAGPDGLTIEIYKRFKEAIAPHLLQMFNYAISSSSLPQSLYEASIVLLSKPGKDPTQLDAYRPISLLTTDIKILAKIIAQRVAKALPLIISEDQTGFMANKATALNIRRLYLNLATKHDNCGQRAVAALDITKAFDTVEWEYLWHTLQRFNFGPSISKWVKLLYHSPKAAIVVNGSNTNYFPLQRGTRQGCPLSPLLFAIAMEPFAQAIRQATEFTGWKLGNREERIQLYADATLIYLGDLGPSIRTLTNITSRFARVSGLVTSLAKSVILPVDPQHPSGNQLNMPFPIVQQFTYLGVVIKLPLSDYYSLNVLPVKNYIQKKIKAWESLLIGPMGRIHLIKIILLPKLTYALLQAPCVIKKRVFYCPGHNI